MSESNVQDVFAGMTDEQRRAAKCAGWILAAMAVASAWILTLAIGGWAFPVIIGACGVCGFLDAVS